MGDTVLCTAGVLQPPLYTSISFPVLSTGFSAPPLHLLSSSQQKAKLKRPSGPEFDEVTDKNLFLAHTTSACIKAESTERHARLRIPNVSLDPRSQQPSPLHHTTCIRTSRPLHSSLIETSYWISFLLFTSCMHAPVATRA